MPYIGEIRMFACNFAPMGFLPCNGQVVPTPTATALFAVVRTNFGGNGTSNFMLPNLQIKGPIGQGQGQGLSPRVIGATGGFSTVALSVNQIPAHNHQPAASLPATSNTPVGNTFSSPGNVRPAPNFYTDQTNSPAPMNIRAMAVAGQNYPHNNLMPFLIVNFCIATTGDTPNNGL